MACFILCQKGLETIETERFLFNIVKYTGKLHTSSLSRQRGDVAESWMKMVLERKKRKPKKF